MLYLAKCAFLSNTVLAQNSSAIEICVLVAHILHLLSFDIHSRTMAYRSQPYAVRHTKQASPPVKLDLWSAGASKVHPLKMDQENADTYFITDRSLAVFDGVSGMAEISIKPAAMSSELAFRVSEALKQRLTVGAQVYDRDNAKKSHIVVE